MQFSAQFNITWALRPQAEQGSSSSWPTPQINLKNKWKKLTARWKRNKSVAMILLPRGIYCVCFLSESLIDLTDCRPKTGESGARAHHIYFLWTYTYWCIYQRQTIGIICGSAAGAQIHLSHGGEANWKFLRFALCSIRECVYFDSCWSNFVELSEFFMFIHFDGQTRFIYKNTLPVDDASLGDQLMVEPKTL